MEAYTLDPKVKVSDADIRELPLYNFHVVVVVEPDPETLAVTVQCNPSNRPCRRG